MNKRNIGKQYEELAEAYLTEHGIRIVEKNFRIRQGEIDLIGYDGRQLVFIEVKYRKNMRSGNPAEAVSYQKQCQICKIAEFYLAFHARSSRLSCRYDVIAICGSEIVWYRNAFDHIGQ